MKAFDKIFFMLGVLFLIIIIIFIGACLSNIFIKLSLKLS